MFQLIVSALTENKCSDDRTIVIDMRILTVH